MKKKTVHKRASSKKIKGFFYYKKKLFIVTLGVLSLLFLANILFPKNNTFPDCANSVSCIQDLSGYYDENNSGHFAGKPVSGPLLADKPYSETESTLALNVLGETSDKHIYVDLTNQKLYAFEGNKLVYDFKVSTGNPWTPTPTGDFRIWIKLKYTRMKGEGYDLPNVPYTMYFANNEIKSIRGYGIHGAYWHENFGVPMSHGCVNMNEPDAELLFNWATPVSSKNSVRATPENPGTLVTIYGTTPSK